MFRLKIVLITLVVTFAHWTAYAPDADAGLLRNWLNRRRQRLCCQATPAVPVATTAYAGLQPGQCQTTCQQTCSRVVVNYVPCTSYRTTYERVPVTTYRPQTSSDPCTGCTVTCMRPCTTYTYQTRRVPYTTYRPVYRTETFKVPVTTITNDCNTCGLQPTCDSCGVQPTCSTCSTGGLPTAAGTQFSSSVQSVPNGTLTTDGNFGLPPGTTLPPGSTVTPLPTPADGIPSIINPQDSNRSLIDATQGGSSTRFQFPETNPPQNNQRNWTLTSDRSTLNKDWSNTPAVSVAANSPVTKKWDYSPVKQASYVSVVPVEAEPAIRTIRGKFAAVDAARNTESSNNGTSANQGWKTVQW